MIGQQVQVPPAFSKIHATGAAPRLVNGRIMSQDQPSSLELPLIQSNDFQLALRINALLEAQIATSFSVDRYNRDTHVAFINHLYDCHLANSDFSRVVLREPSAYLPLSSQQELIDRPILLSPVSKAKSGLDLLRDASIVATTFATTAKDNEDLLSGQLQSDSWRTAVSSSSDPISVTDGTKGSTSDSNYIDTIREWDVLCGRGGRSNRHPGNKRYRQVVAEMKIMYRGTKAKAIKTDLSRAIVKYVFGYGGRFVKKDEETGSYYVLSPGEARKKTSQALRETKELKWTL